MKKLPWGIIAGICGIIVFYTIVGTVAAYIVLDAIANQTSESATLFDTWYQTLLFIGDIVFGLGLIGSAVMWFITRSGNKKSAEVQTV